MVDPVSSIRMDKRWPTHAVSVSPSWSVSFMLSICLLYQSPACLADVNSGCPFWGCLPWGSFSLSSGIPKTTANVQWRVLVEELPLSNYSSLVPRGCVSDQQTVVCTTQSGYVSIDPTKGTKLWNYTTRSSPYLPIMDIYSDVIGMDTDALYYVGANGVPKTPIGLAQVKPHYSLMIANNSIMALTSSQFKMAQIFTYDTDGVIDASLSLTGSINRADGIFLPCSHPIIAGHRMYVMTCFVSENEPTKVTGMRRLYAIDVLAQLAPRIKIAWYFNFGKWEDSGSSETIDTQPDPFVTYFGGTVYVSVPDFLKKDWGAPMQPYPGTIWAIRDDGDRGTLLFKTSCLYGPMAVFDTYRNPLSRSGPSGTSGHVVWTMNHSPPMIQGFDSLNGSRIQVTGLAAIFESLGGWITTRLTITRSSGQEQNDQLVFGLSDSSGQARLVVIEIDSKGQAKLVFSRLLSKSAQHADSTSLVEGQIVNFAFYLPSGRTDQWTFGLAAVVTEMSSTQVTRNIVGVF